MNEHEDEILELGDDFDFDGFQVVRREFLPIRPSRRFLLTTASSM